MLCVHQALLGAIFGLALIHGKGLVDSCMVDVNLLPQACTCLMSTRNHYCTKISSTVNTTDISIACEGWSFLLSDGEHHQEQFFTTGCFYLERSGLHPRLIFILITTLSTIIVSLDANNFNGFEVCNTTDDFSVLLNKECISTRGLADLVKSRPGCSNSDSITRLSVNVTNKNNLIEYHFVDDQFQLTPVELIDCSNETSITVQASTISTDPWPPDSSSVFSTVTTHVTKKSTPSTAPLVGLSVGISASVLLLILFIIIIIAVLWVTIRRKPGKQMHDCEHQDCSHSTHQDIDTQSQSNDQFHLSPLNEFIHSAENKPTSNIIWQPQADYQEIYSCIDTEQPKPVSQEMEEDDPMYDVIRKGNDKKQSHINKDSHDGPSVQILPNDQHATATSVKASTTDDIEQKPGEEALKEMYAVVNKKIKVAKEESAPPIPPYVADHSVQKDPKSDTSVDGEEASPILPQCHNGAEELYTAVKKKPKENKGEEIAPPIPPHTVEELYTAVVKKPKESVMKDIGEEPPPIPPYTIDKSHNDN